MKVNESLLKPKSSREIGRPPARKDQIGCSRGNCTTFSRCRGSQQNARRSAQDSDKSGKKPVRRAEGDLASHDTPLQNSGRHM